MTNTKIIEIAKRSLKSVQDRENIVNIVDVDYWLFDDVIGEHEIPVSGFIRVSEFIEALREDLNVNKTPLLKQLSYDVEEDATDYNNAQYIIADTPALFDLNAKGVYIAI